MLSNCREEAIGDSTAARCPRARTECVGAARCIRCRHGASRLQTQGAAGAATPGRRQECSSVSGCLSRTSRRVRQRPPGARGVPRARRQRRAGVPYQPRIPAGFLGRSLGRDDGACSRTGAGGASPTRVRRGRRARVGAGEATSSGRGRRSASPRTGLRTGRLARMTPMLRCCSRPRRTLAPASRTGPPSDHARRRSSAA